jgi:phosphoglycerate dehydrogenase-like enzyme
LPNVTLTSHAACKTRAASARLLRMGLDAALQAIKALD